LIQIAELMKYISNWLPHQRERNMTKAQAIADYNQQYFFSKEFYTRINEELKNNLMLALTELENTNSSKQYIDRRKQFSKIDCLKEIITGNKSTVDTKDYSCQDHRTRKTVAMTIAKARQYYLQNTKE